MTSQQHHDFDVAVHDNWNWLVNGRRPRGRVRDRLESDLDSTEWIRRYCPYCQHRLHHTAFRDDFNDFDRASLHRDFELQACEQCLFWQFRGSEATRNCMDSPVNALASSIARRCQASLPDVCAEELALLLRRHPELWSKLTPTQLEHFVADVFKANFTACEVLHVGRPGDRGVDVVFVDSGDNTWLIQVKRRGRRHPVEGYATLQSILGALVIHGHLRGIIVTTADYFSAPVRREIDQLRTRGYFVELVDRGKLSAMLGPLLPYQPWLQVLDLEVFTGVDRELKRRLLMGMPDSAQGTLFTPTF